MEYVLVDIKNFLKKLENGQMEIEAGQWELHKTLESMSKTVTELSNLKDDVADMRRSNLHQMGLIKQLQLKLDKISQTSGPITMSESSVECSDGRKRSVDGQALKKRKCIRDEDLIHMMSEMSNEKSETELDGSGSGPQHRPPPADENEFKADENEKNSDEESSQNIYKKESYIISAQNKPDSQCPVHNNNDILQRYLKDSARYYENKKSNSNDCSSKYVCEEGSTCTETEIRPFWDEYGSRGKKESITKECSNSKEKSVEAPNSEKNSLPKEFSCSNCSEKFESNIDFLRHKKQHRKPKTILICSACGKGFSSKHNLREHATSHKFSTRYFKGFKCCYCKKVCCTPKKLTEHVRKCRTIIRKFKK